MDIKQSFLQGKITSRTLLLFSLSTLIPVTYLGFLSYYEYKDLLLKQAYIKLRTTNQIYSTAVQNRLSQAGRLLQQIDHGFMTRPIAAAIRNGKTDQMFQSLAFVSTDGLIVHLAGTETTSFVPHVEAIKHALRKSTPLLIPTAGPDGKNVILIQPGSDQTTGKGVFLALMHPGYLWRTPAEDPSEETHLCVLNEHHVTLFCDLPDIANLLGLPVRERILSSQGQITWQKSNETYLAGYQKILLPAYASKPYLAIIAMQNETSALAPLASYRTILWSSAGLSLFLILLLGAIQVWRILIPLRQLEEGIRRIEHNNFKTRIAISRDDEFGELTDCFNAMLTSLGNRFDTLTALSKIDQTTLSESGVNQVITDALTYLKKIPTVDSASLSVFKPDAPEKISVYQINPENQKQLSGSIQVLSHGICTFLLNNPNGICATSDSVRHLLRIAHSNETNRYFFILPLKWKQHLIGFVSLGSSAIMTWSEEETTHIRDYTNRIAIALFARNREDLLRQQARIDPLTGLPNRLLFIEQLQKEISRTQRAEQQLAVLYIDLDRFKVANDSLGHSIGDQLLQEAGSRLYQCTREGDTVARLGGDEFALIINQLGSGQHASTVASNAITALSRPFIFHDMENTVTASMGIVLYPQDGSSVPDLMRNADTAMYRAKEKGGNQYVFFEESMNVEAIRRSSIERELRRAISERQFILHYQPQVAPKTGKIRGVEALVRWIHPAQGIIGPTQFIGIAEDTGLIAEIGDIVLEEACKQYRVWHDQGIELEYVAVNVSVRQFHQPDFIRKVVAALKTYDMPAKCLELEITESILVDDTQVTASILHELKSLGVHISIDDFGTGYSSMSYLEQLPFDTLKIDMSFVRRIRDNGEGGIIAATIVAMAHALNKQIVAEGVETQAQFDFLLKHDCEMIQGYYYSRPLPAAELATFVKNRTEPAGKLKLVS